jgi:hypothetical protein
MMGPLALSLLSLVLDQMRVCKDAHVTSASAIAYYQPGPIRTCLYLEQILQLKS